MMKQTMQLFAKALIIGVLINLGLQQVPVQSSGPIETNYLQEQHPLKNSSADNLADFTK